MAKPAENQLDNIFYAIGDLKIFTVLQFMAVLMSTYPMAYQLLSNVFTCRSVPYRCAHPQNESDLLDGFLDYADNLTVSYEKCQIVVSTNDTVLKTESCIYGMQYDLPKDASCISQFDLVCGHTHLARLSQTLVIAGQGLGAILGTIAGDRLGRKPVLVVCNLGLFLVGMGIAFSPNYILFATLKFFIGCFQQGLVTINLTLILELLTRKKRRHQAWFAGLVWGTAVMSLALWSYLLRNFSWRILHMALSLACLPAFIQFWYVWESLRWTIANGKSKAAVAYIKHATKVNKTDFQRALQAYEEICYDKGRSLQDQCLPKTMTASRKYTVLDLMKIKRLLLNSVVMWIAWFTTTLSFYAIYLTSSSLAGNRYLNFFLTALMEIPANIYLLLALNRLGRRLSLIGAFALISIGLITSGIFRSLEANSINSTLALVFAMMAMMGASSSFSMVYFYTPEIFPTNIRTQAVGVSSMVGRIGGMLAPFTGVLSEEARWGPGVLIGSLAFLCAILLPLLPETTGKDLPQTLEDMQKWHEKKQKDNEMEEVKQLTSNHKTQHHI